MRYRIDHLTEYQYSATVSLSMQIAHLKPRECESQYCISHSLKVLPAPASQREDFDYFGNPITRLELVSPHDSLRVSASSEVRVVRQPIADHSAALDWRDLRAVFASLLWPDARHIEAGEFIVASPYVPALSAVREYMAPFASSDMSVLEFARTLMEKIHADFTFDPTATHVATPLEEVISERRGVCQDYAHFMIACLRACGLPARYMSGYLLTEPPPGQERLVGADASHAWVAVWEPNLGWLEFDPTNALMPSDQHIITAWGRDFGDVSPLRGVILGGGEHEVNVAVTVTPLDAS